MIFIIIHFLKFFLTFTISNLFYLHYGFLVKHILKNDNKSEDSVERTCVKFDILSRLLTIDLRGEVVLCACAFESWFVQNFVTKCENTRSQKLL